MSSADSLNPGHGLLVAGTDYLELIHGAGANPEALERLYQSARRSGAGSAFRGAIAVAHQESPENLLYGAWYYRLHQPDGEGFSRRFAGISTWAVPIGVVLGLALWVFSDGNSFRTSTPLLIFLAPSLVALAIVVFLATSGRRSLAQALAGVALAAMVAYIFLLPVSLSDSQGALILLHLPLLAWGAIGLAALGWRSSSRARFGFITKSLDAIGTGGVFGIAGSIFAVVAIGLFEVLDVQIPDLVIRLVVSLIAGLVTIIAIATVYDPALAPDQQEFGRGFGRLLNVLMRVLLALSLIVLVIYVVVIPFNFGAPFENRTTLIIYNVMLFGVIAVLIGSTPVNSDDLSPQIQSLLRGALIAVAALTALVSLYALAATVYRTATFDGLTMNRTTIIGWNVINIALLIALLVGQIRARRENWTVAVQSVFAWGAIAYVVWAAVVGLALPWLFAR
ncbi:MAG TPA: hypothetical protein VH591_13350 [Ktedonobacterales bacterium]|jgi:hypothetical protein